jgi:hypothetical protein
MQLIDCGRKTGELAAITFLAIVVAVLPVWVLRPAEHLMWERTQRADTAQAYQEYLSLYWMDGKHVAEALKRWVELTHKGDPKALQLPPRRRWRAT